MQHLKFGVLVFFLCWGAESQMPDKEKISISMPEIKTDDLIIPRYTFQNKKQLTNLKMHYYTLGSPKKNEKGEIDNAVLLLHWTAASGEALLSSNFIPLSILPAKFLMPINII